MKGFVLAMVLATSAMASDPVDEKSAGVQGIPSGGRWVAAAEPVDAPLRLLVMDVETKRVFELLQFVPGVEVSLKWKTEDLLEITANQGVLVIKAEPAKNKEEEPLFTEVEYRPGMKTIDQNDFLPVPMMAGTRSANKFLRRTAKIADRAIR